MKVYLNDSPGFNFGLNNPSKNCVAQWGFTLPVGLTNVTVVPAGIRIHVGYIPLTEVESGGAVGDALVRASKTVLFTVLPSTGLPDTSLRTYGGDGVGAGGRSPPI